ncbi:hypothetical protein EJD97_014219 [Solanum chilense]|uniref:Uncharacterized protein n=1 Tax=Solanum chilense TaxID=4083 RepID=A0A6N2B9K3_SOLCI|nr:hypothetical protein EJD97_014219 [Solanum chilense]
MDSLKNFSFQTLPPTDTKQSLTRATAQARTPPVARQEPPDLRQMSAWTRCKDAMNTVRQEEFEREADNISPGISGRNRYERMVEMNNIHHNLSCIQESGNSTIPISRNREATLQNSASEMDGRVAGEENSGEIRVRNVKKNCTSSNNTEPQAKANQPTSYSD